MNSKYLSDSVRILKKPFNEDNQNMNNMKTKTYKNVCEDQIGDQRNSETFKSQKVTTDFARQRRERFCSIMDPPPDGHSSAWRPGSQLFRADRRHSFEAQRTRRRTKRISAAGNTWSSGAPGRRRLGSRWGNPALYPSNPDSPA